MQIFYVKKYRKIDVSFLTNLRFFYETRLVSGNCLFVGFLLTFSVCPAKLHKYRILAKDFFEKSHFLSEIS